MKKNLLLLLLLSTHMFSQELNITDENVLVKPTEGKSLVYIARREQIAMLVKFGVYDGDLFLGKLAANRYFAYDCDPGEHVFIAKGENTFYLDANLEEGRVYVLDLHIEMGILTGRVRLVPLSVLNKKFEKNKTKFLSFLKKKKGELISVSNENIDTEEVDEEMEIVSNGQSKRLAKFYDMKQKGKKMAELTSEMYFD